MDALVNPTPGVPGLTPVLLCSPQPGKVTRVAPHSLVLFAAHDFQLGGENCHRTQFPIVLACTVTVYKAQGLTFDRHFDIVTAYLNAKIDERHV